MGAVAFVVFMLILLGFGLVVAVGALIGTILSAVHKRKTLCIVMSILLAVGLMIVAVPVTLVGFILYTNTIVPSDFVDTGIVIEGDIYQDDYFTANGVTYRKLDLDPNYAVCENIATPVFSYKPEGILNRHEWQNFYRLETDHSFELIWDGSFQLYCPAQQFSAVTNYYSSCNQKYLDGSWEIGRSLSLNTTRALSAYLTLADTLPIEEVTEKVQGEYSIWCYSDDGIVLTDVLSFLSSGNNLYEEYSYTYDGSDYPVITGRRVPDALAAALLPELRG